MVDEHRPCTYHSTDRLWIGCDCVKVSQSGAGKTEKGKGERKKDEGTGAAADEEERGCTGTQLAVKPTQSESDLELIAVASHGDDPTRISGIFFQFLT
jgi:hypothetical protein